MKIKKVHRGPLAPFEPMRLTRSTCSWENYTYLPHREFDVGITEVPMVNNLKEPFGYNPDE